MQGVMPAQAGIHGGKKAPAQHGAGMGSRLRGNDAAVLLLTPYAQQSGTIGGIAEATGIFTRNRDAPRQFSLAVNGSAKDPCYFVSNLKGGAGPPKPA